MDNLNILRNELSRLKEFESFPISKDEYIINLSDPPFFTICPNPFLKNISSDAKSPKRVTEPYAFDVREGKNDPIYNIHAYHTKVPYKAIMRYILYYTNPGELIYDGFSGSGMTGIAARMCNQKDDLIEKEFKKLEIPIEWGVRKAVLSDISPFASFLSYYMNSIVNLTDFENKAKNILNQIENEFGRFYETIHTINERIQYKKDLMGDKKTIKGIINYIVWSDVFICDQCGEKLIFWDISVDLEKSMMIKVQKCTNCSKILKKRKLERVTINVYDNYLARNIRIAKMEPVLIKYTIIDQRGKKRTFEKKPTSHDLNLIEEINEFQINDWFPTDKLPDGYNTKQPMVSHGYTNVHHFFHKRNLIVLSKVYSLAKQQKLVFLDLCITFSMIRSSHFYKFTLDRKMGAVTGTLYIPSLRTENNTIKLLKRKLKDFLKFVPPRINSVYVNCGSSSEILLPSNSIDYIFTDPPFGGNLMYSELNYIWESWLRVKTNNTLEAIENKVQKKNLFSYKNLMEKCFKENYRILKPGKWMTVEFHNSKNSVWMAIQEAISISGFIVADVRTLDKKQGTFKQVTTTTAVKQDLIISCYKPPTDLEFIAEVEQSNESMVWKFIDEHLNYLPIVIKKENIIEIVSERQKYLLFDRMISFFVQRGLYVPISSGEFYLGLHKRYPERDDMFFLSEQVVTFDKVKLKAGGIYQTSLFIIDEKSGINWLSKELKNPQTYQSIQPKFLQDLVKNKYEKMPELLDLLKENFLIDEKNRWFVPDPNEQSDLEKLREKALIKEFEIYISSKEKIKQLRIEAVRTGFKKAWSNKKYDLIVKIGDQLPSAVLQEDDSLLMYYDNASIRLGK